MPFRVGVIGVVFGPQGLDEKRLTSLVTRDEEVINQLARYAEQTAELEITIGELNAMEEADEAVAPPARYGTPEQALLALLRSVNPAAASYDPFSAGRRQGPSTKAGQAAEGFLDNAGAIVPGGGALTGLKGFLMPDTEFRSVFAQPEGTDGMTFCGHRVRARGRTRTTYFWASRLLGTAAPTLDLVGKPEIQAGRRNLVPVRLAADADTDSMDKFYEWRLEPTTGIGGAPQAARVKAIPGSRALMVDLGEFKGEPGVYRLVNKWDWDSSAVRGELRVHAPHNLKAARATREGAIFADSGIQHLRYDSADFHFVERAELVRPGGWRGARPLDFAVTGTAADRLEVVLDSARLEPGRASLRLTTTNGLVEELPLDILPPIPEIEGLPLRANLGEARVRVPIRSAGLEQIESIRVTKGTSTYSNGVLEVALPGDVKAGEYLSAQVALKGHTGSGTIARLLQVAPRRPRISEVKAAPISETSVTLRSGELPSDSMVSYSVKFEDAPGQSSISVECSDAVRTLTAVKVRIGERTPLARVERMTENSLLLVVNPAVGSTGCQLMVAIESEGSGKSEPVALGKVVRVPSLKGFDWLEEKSPEGFQATITGQGLEVIEKVGWEASRGVAVSAMPLAMKGDDQSLKVSLPWPPPSPHAPLFIWLRGDSEGRSSKLKP